MVFVAVYKLLLFFIIIFFFWKLKAKKKAKCGREKGEKNKKFEQ